jgi:putative hydrolase of HD superfamily
MLEFLESINKLKSIPRSGWISHGVSWQDVESVADHSYSTCAIALVLADLELKRGARLDVERVLRMAVLHDIAESLTFDISKAYLEYVGRRGDAIKNELEHSAWEHVARGIGDPKLAREYARSQAEHAANRTVESKLVHAADKLDILLRIIEYRRRGYPKSMFDDLWKTTSIEVRASRIPSVRRIHALVLAAARRVR